MAASTKKSKSKKKGAKKAAKPAAARAKAGAAKPATAQTGPAKPQARPEVETTVSELPESRVRLEVEVPAREVDRAVERAAGTMARELKMPGFRKGKVPPAVVVQRVGREALMEQALQDSLADWYEAALLPSNIATVGEPKLDVKDMPAEGESLSFSIEVGVRPPAKLGDYKGLEVGRREPEVPPEAVEHEVELLRDSLGHLETVERPIKQGDFAVLDFIGTIEGEPFEGGRARDYLLELGSEALVPGFEEQLAGLKAGDEKDVEIDFPADYRAEDLAGKHAVFHVTVKAVQEKHLPELDDELADSNTEFETLEELRSDVAKKLSEAQEASIDEEFREAAVDSAVREAKVDVPAELAHARAHEMWHSLARSLQRQGIDPTQYLKVSGKEEEELVTEMQPEAEQALKREAVLAAVAEAEGLEVTDAELIEGLKSVAERSNVTPEQALDQLKQAGRDEGLREDLRLRQAVDVLTDNAAPIDVETAKAREKLWTPEKEEEAKASDLWTPGSD